MRGLLLGLMLLLVPLPVAAESAIKQARALIATYHQELARLDQARDLMEIFLRQDSRVEGMILLSRIYYMWGDMRALTRDDKLAAYERGRQLGRRAMELAPRDPEAHFWYAVNTGRWGQTKGVLRALFLLPTMRKEIDIILTLAPDHPGGLGLSANVELALPWGDLEKAEKQFRKGLKVDPRHTALRVDLARLLIKRGKYEKARKELKRVLNEKKPRSFADWKAKHTQRARDLLSSIEDRS